MSNILQIVQEVEISISQNQNVLKVYSNLFYPASLRLFSLYLSLHLVTTTIHNKDTSDGVNESVKWV